MQRAILLAALLVGSACAAGFGAREGKTLVAKVWLQAHNSHPNTDELAELKDENPDAYALVKALLTKRSLGLLDPRHPTASFAHNAAPVDEDVPRGPAVFAKFATKTELAKMDADSDASASAVYPEAAPVVHSNKNWLNWRPSQSASDDDNMVKNVLGSVAELSAPAPKRSNLISQSRADAPLYAANAAPVEVARIEAPASPMEVMSPVVPASSEIGNNDYLDSIGGFSNQDMGSKPGAKAGASLIKQTAHEDNNNYLASFSWDDNKHAQQQSAVVNNVASQADASSLMKDASDLDMPAAEGTTMAPSTLRKSASGGGNALMKWLR